MATKKSEYNQIANFVYTEQQINIRLQDKPPFEYLQQIQQDIEQVNNNIPLFHR